MATRYWPAPELADLAAPIIAEHHPLLTEHPGDRIVWVWRDKAKTSRHKVTLGTASLVTGRAAMLIEAARTGALDDRAKNIGFDDHDLFVIEIAQDEWRSHLDEAQRLALLDHELAHCHVAIEYDEDNPEMEIGRTLEIREHDIEEFRAIVERHGLWHHGLEDFAHAIKQSPRPPERRRARRPTAQPQADEALARYGMVD